MNAKNYLNRTVTLKIDRPLGTKNPRWDYIYMLNYGYVDDSITADGHEVDAYLLGVFEPVETYTGRCIALIHHHDNDDKLIVVPDGKVYTDEQIRSLIEFQERFYNSEVWR